MKKLLIQIQQDPYANSSVSEGLDLAFAAATYDVEVAIVFAKEGLACLMTNQQTSEIQRRSVLKKINSLPIYGIERIYALNDLNQNLEIPTSEDIEQINKNQLKQLYSDFDEIQVF